VLQLDQVPKKKGPMFIMVWRCTHGCNLNCMYCSFRGGDLPKVPAPDELDVKGALHVVDEIHDFGATWFGLSGGEPLTRDDIFEPIQYARKLGMSVSVITNGYFVNGETFNRLVKEEVLTSISMDGREQIQDKLRGKGFYKTALAAAKKLSSVGLLDCLVTTVNKLNLDEMDHLVQVAEDNQAKRLVIHNYVPVGNGKYNIELAPNADEYEKLWNHVYDLYQEYKGKVDIKVYSPFYARVVKERGMHNFWDWYANDFLGRCTMDGHYVSISPNGDVKPCGFNETLKLGNLRDRTLREIWDDLQNDEFYLKIRDKSNLKGKCGVCEYREICGGCRTRAEYYTGDLFESDPACAYIPKVLRE
jgi:AdoMet-dependent heme synthase